jgi:hypothetical protein
LYLASLLEIVEKSFHSTKEGGIFVGRHNDFEIDIGGHGEFLSGELRIECRSQDENNLYLFRADDIR